MFRCGCPSRRMPGCTIVDFHTPLDALGYFRTINNDLNAESSGVSFLDSYSLIDDISAAWLRERKNNQSDDVDEDLYVFHIKTCVIACTYLGLASPDRPLVFRERA